MENAPKICRNTRRLRKSLWPAQESQRVEGAFECAGRGYPGNDYRVPTHVSLRATFDDVVTWLVIHMSQTIFTVVAVATPVWYTL